jgi:hypothetical protein
MIEKTKTTISFDRDVHRGLMMLHSRLGFRDVSQYVNWLCKEALFDPAKIARSLAKEHAAKMQFYRDQAESFETQKKLVEVPKDGS